MRYLCFFTLLFIVFNTKAQTTGQPKADASIPEHVQKWLAAKTAIKKGKATQKGFFRTDSIKIVGYVKGYNKSANYASGIIYHANNLTREDFPITVRIYEDGRLECSLLAVHPISSHILINDHTIQFYAEPGTTLGIVFDYKATEYMGINKDINDQLAALEMARADYDHLTEYRKTQKPDDFKQVQLRNWERARRNVDSVMRVKHTADRVKKLVDNQVDLTYANYLLTTPCRATIIRRRSRTMKY